MGVETHLQQIIDKFPSALGSDNADAVAAAALSALRAAVMLYVYNGASWDRMRAPNVFKTHAVVAVGSEVTIWTPASGKKFRYMGGVYSMSAAVNILLKDNTGGTTIYDIPPTSANLGVCHVVGALGILSAAANNVLTATGSGAANLSGVSWGTEE